MGKGPRDTNVNKDSVFDPMKGYGDRLYKIILLGTASTGKTSLLIRFVDDVYNSDSIMNTVGVDLKGVTL